MKTLPRVASEMALHVLAYNLTRVMNIMGIRPLMAAMRAYPCGSGSLAVILKVAIFDSGRDHLSGTGNPRGRCSAAPPGRDWSGFRTLSIGPQPPVFKIQ